MKNLPELDIYTNESEDDFWAFVEALQNQTVAELLRAGDDVEQQKQAIKRYFRCGDKVNLAINELWIFSASSQIAF